ncbi:TVG0674750 [Thermoplasma volcanium GSS1]|uniref:TVG0674750 protein n=1 Tax=Thermoplasma volcanium (strain ATCC 51530 / DSM 4299 / JCM 9571 / NBRC 15438 / GSS1) TaxID=273116 RepID=Q97AY4_THEVO|nr:TVG0674750 [Thermoplasma volcanium GSS1]
MRPIQEISDRYNGFNIFRHVETEVRTTYAIRKFNGTVISDIFHRVPKDYSVREFSSNLCYIFHKKTIVKIASNDFAESMSGNYVKISNGKNMYASCYEI